MAPTVTGLVCPCPGKPHEAEGDSVTLRERLDLAGGVRCQAIVELASREKLDTPTLAAKLAEAYLLVGVVSWTFVDDHGKPVILDEKNIRRVLLSDFTLSGPVAEKADELYQEPVIGPLVRKALPSSPTSPTESSTSATTNGSHASRKRSRRSSTSTTPTAVTETT